MRVEASEVAVGAGEIAYRGEWSDAVAVFVAVSGVKRKGRRWCSCARVQGQGS